jgi:hypothetical protein
MAVVLAAVLAIACPGQGVYTSPTPVCFSFNDASPPSATTATVGCSGVYVHFGAPASAAIEEIEFWSPGGGLAGVPIAILAYQTSALGVPPSTPLIGVFLGSFGSANDWKKVVSTAPVNLTAGSTYAILIAVSPFPGPSQCANCVPLSYDAAAATLFPYHFVQNPSCPLTVPSVGTFGLRMRFRGVGCGPGPLASVGPSLGSSCGSNGYPAYLYSSSPPVLGSTFTVSVSGPQNESAWLFWSGGVNPTGSPLAGSSCLTYLDVASANALAALGAQPLLTGVLSGVALGYVTWNIPVPPSPAHAGLVIGLQAAVTGPSGTILGQGHVSNGLKLVLGF